jgi:hypothetical protein
MKFSDSDVRTNECVMSKVSLRNGPPRPEAVVVRAPPSSSHLQIRPACQPAEQGRDIARDTNDSDCRPVRHVMMKVVT